jgi:signal transduction histidine kinase
MLKLQNCLLRAIFIAVAIIYFSQLSLAQYKSYNELDSLFNATLENHPDEAMQHVMEMEKIPNLTPSQRLEALEKKAQCHLLFDQFDEAMQLRYKILNQYEKQQNHKMAVRTLFNLGNQYFQMHDHNRALDMFLKAKVKATTKGDPIDTIKINMEMGLQLAGLKKFDEGIFILKTNLPLAKKHLTEEDWAIGVDNLSNVYHEMGDYTNSLKYQLEVYHTQFAHSTIHNKTAINQHLAEIYINLANYKEAQYHLDSAFHYGRILGSNDWLFDCYKNQYQIDQAQGNYKSALLNHEKYLSLKDSVYQSQYDTKMSAMANLYELEHKQGQIKKLEYESSLSKTRIQRLTLALLALGLIALTAYLYYLVRRKREAAETQRKFANMLVETQEEERQRIAKELHDSVGQNVLFIKNQIKKLFNDTQPQLTSSVDGILENVRSISKDLYPNELERYGLENAIELLAKQVTEEFGVFVSSDLSNIDKHLSKNTKINLYRIIQEFINNSLKHAQSKAIRITSSVKGNRLEMILQDNGIGFDNESIKNKALRSFGLLNIEERIKMMKGQLIYETAPGQGTKFIIHLPY